LLNPFKLHRLLSAVSSSLLTDPKLDLLSLARSFELLSAGDISFATLPNNGSQVIYPDGVQTAIVRIDYAAVPGFVRSITGHPPDPALGKVSAARPAQVTLDVLNGTTRYKLATRNAQQLKRLGFTVNVVDSTPAPVAATSVLYRPGQQAAAKAVAKAVPGAKLVETTSVRRVTLELGGDGRQVQGLASRSTVRAPAPHTRKPALGCID
jgi:hypothetical protein